MVNDDDRRELDLVAGVDVGGTFTDCVLFDPHSGRVRAAKVPTTPQDQARGFMAGLDELGVEGPALRSLIHGTTVATNTVLERTGCRCGLITTMGFRDVLELGRRVRPQLYGLSGAFEPVVPRDLRVEVGERIDAAGNVLVPIDEDEAAAAVRSLLERGVEALAICFLHSYANAVHEERCYDLARAIWPNDHISVSARVLPELREFERSTAVALNAYVQPRISGYVSRLSGMLSDRQVPGDLLVMQGSGGLMDAATAQSHAIHTVMSGPAAGAIAAGRIGAQAGLDNLISCDLGGTSFDVCVVSNGVPAITREKDLDYSVPMRLPMVDIHTIGAGGGSIARVHQGPMLAVGPESAGADPGPVAYGRGGTEPTLTDANVLLGRLDPERMAGAARRADLEAVRSVFRERIAGPLGLDTTAAAAGVVDVATNAMATAIRFVSVQKGLDPRDFAIFAFGGAGPLFSSALAKELGIPRVLVPRHPGLTSAFGCILADVRHDFGETVNVPLAEVDGATADAVLQRQAEAGRRLIEHERVAVREVQVSHEADLQYFGQTHVMRLPVGSPGFDCERVRSDLETTYRRRFDVDLSDMRAVLVSLRTTVTGIREDIGAGVAPDAAGGDGRPTGRREVYFGGDTHDTDIFARENLDRGQEIRGPAIVEQPDTTVVLEPGDRAVVDDAFNLMVTFADGETG